MRDDVEQTENLERVREGPYASWRSSEMERGSVYVEYGSRTEWRAERSVGSIPDKIHDSEDQVGMFRRDAENPAHRDNSVPIDIGSGSRGGSLIT